MLKIFNISNVHIYRFRYALFYVLIGITSIAVELITYNLLLIFGFKLFLSSFLSVLTGIIIAFWLNIRYNFKIAKPKRFKSLKYFIAISLSSYLIQIFLINTLKNHISYEFSRIIISGSLFWIAYLFHLKFSFKDYKKVGVAIYANGVEDINSIHNRIGDFADFIHIDIVDSTFKIDAPEVKAYKSEVVKAYWKNKFIEAHIMSKDPLPWIKEIGNYVDRIYVHTNIINDIKYILNCISEYKCEAGIVVSNESDLQIVTENLDYIKSILILAIPNPGFSGQKFNMDVLEVIDKINKASFRERITLNVDGGINDSTIHFINSENVVSGSYVLNASDPKLNIKVLQTSGQYESL